MKIEIKIKISTETLTRKIGERPVAYVQLTTTAAAAIKSVLDTVNGNAMAFTVHEALDVLKLADRAEIYLDDRCVPLSDRAGAQLVYVPSSPRAAAYKNSPISTALTLSRTSSGWFLTGVERCVVWPLRRERFVLTISDKAAENLVRRTLRPFGRAPEANKAA